MPSWVALRWPCTERREGLWMYALGRIKVLAIDDLIRMKRSSARPQDLEDIKTLEAIRAKKN